MSSPSRRRGPPPQSKPTQTVGRRTLRTTPTSHTPPGSLALAARCRSFGGFDVPPLRAVVRNSQIEHAWKCQTRRRSANSLFYRLSAIVYSPRCPASRRPTPARNPTFLHSRTIPQQPKVLPHPTSPGNRPSIRFAPSKAISETQPPTTVGQFPGTASQTTLQPSTAVGRPPLRPFERN
jgi:hypothetical protein